MSVVAWLRYLDYFTKYQLCKHSIFGANVKFGVEASKMGWRVDRNHLKEDYLMVQVAEGTSYHKLIHFTAIKVQNCQVECQFTVFCSLTILN